MSRYFGTPLAALRDFVGRPIKTNSSVLIDALGRKLQSGLQNLDNGWIRRHDTIAHKMAAFARQEGADITFECTTIFNAQIGRTEAGRTAYRQLSQQQKRRRALVPDAWFRRRVELGDFKMVYWGSTYRAS